MPDLTWPQMRQLESFFVQTIRNFPGNPVVISEGDSWFSFPVHASLMDHLDEMVQRRMSLLRLESSGAEILDVLDAGGRSSLRKLLRRYKPDVLLFSGGGNDIVGPELLTLIAPRGGGAFDLAAALSRAQLATLFGNIRAAYEALIAIRKEVAPGCIIVTHSYGNAIPSGRGASLWGFPAGPWLKPFLDALGYNAAEQRAVVGGLMQRFNDILDALADPHFIKVDVRPAISDDEWNDEIHPSRKGFEDAARLIHEKLQEILPTKFP
ncbi:MAG TPA: SGNH/GDSL hydrolase family protein [Thermoanaerobaculia bacterium]|nr:SGNH/GDSL hydrolase family protein [Thermoanaerobaculia bacterium]